jgi:hypothetical protein
MSDLKVAKKRPKKVLSAATVCNISEPGRYMDGNCLMLVWSKYSNCLKSLVESVRAD